MKGILENYQKKVATKEGINIGIRYMQEKLDELLPRVKELEDGIAQAKKCLWETSYMEDILVPLSKELAMRLNRIALILTEDKYQLCFINPKDKNDILAITILLHYLEEGKLCYEEDDAFRKTYELPETYEEIILLLKPIPRDYSVYSLKEIGECVTQKAGWEVVQMDIAKDEITFRVPYEDAGYSTCLQAEFFHPEIDDKRRILCDYQKKELIYRLRNSLIPSLTL